MHIAITPTPEDASKLAAKIIIPQVKSGFRLGVATGSTPEGLYAELRAAHAQGQFSLEECTAWALDEYCLLYTSPSPRDGLLSRMPSSA